MRVFWIRDASRRPVACVATTLSSTEADTVRFAIAIPNPRDKFDRARGRAIAEGRLSKPHSRHLAWFVSPREAKRSVMEKIADDTTLPIRVRDAARLWLERPLTTPLRPLGLDPAIAGSDVADALSDLGVAIHETQPPSPAEAEPPAVDFPGTSILEPPLPHPTEVLEEEVEPLPGTTEAEADIAAQEVRQITPFNIMDLFDQPAHEDDTSTHD